MFTLGHTITTIVIGYTLISRMSALPQHEVNRDLLVVCKASADKLRLQILGILQNESFGVTELCQVFNVAQPNMTHHLKILASAGLVQTRKEGTSVFYRRALIADADPFSGLKQKLYDTVDLEPVTTAVTLGVSKVHRQRAQRSQSFFARYADQISENQDLIAPIGSYLPTLCEWLEELPHSSSVIEIGPGESPLLSKLADQFKRVTALDHSISMLQRARVRLNTTSSRRVRFLEADISDFDGPMVDLIVLNMVLHHLSSPSMFFRDAARQLKPGGTLLIADLSPHKQDWARETCGDQWLGFNPVDLTHWSEDAEFTPERQSFLGLNNGFQIQLRQFRYSPTLSWSHTFRIKKE